MNARPLALGLACALGSCTSAPPPRGQVVLYVDTDAPVPEARTDRPDLTRLAPLVDRARFDILVDGKPLAGSSRDFEIDADMLRARRLSFGILPAAHDAGVAVRVRLFRADRVTEGEPEPGVTLDTTVTLPAVEEDGVVPVSVLLQTIDFGKRIGPVPAVRGTIATSNVGTWHGGHHQACAGAAKDGEVCVPGGAFFLGDPAFRGRTFANDVFAERLVWISPFYLDRTEVTVGAFRARWSELAASGALPPIPLAPKRDTGTEADDCPWSDVPTTVDGVDLERVPIACVSWDTARAFCRARGADLPTEAQFEFAASGLGAEQAHVWGNDEPDCGAAVWGRGGFGVYASGSYECRRAGATWLAFPGSGTRDRLDPTPESGGDPEIVDLGGNVAEWTVDTWSRPSESFWNTLEPMSDPLASTPSIDGDQRAVRGGSWAITALTTRAAFRRRRSPTERVAEIGFRCARAATGAP